MSGRSRRTRRKRPNGAIPSFVALVADPGLRMALTGRPKVETPEPRSGALGNRIDS